MCRIRGRGGETVNGVIDNTIHKLGDAEANAEQLADLRVRDTLSRIDEMPMHLSGSPSPFLRRASSRPPHNAGNSRRPLC